MGTGTSRMCLYAGPYVDRLGASPRFVRASYASYAALLGCSVVAVPELVWAIELRMSVSAWTFRSL